ncbi:MAG: AMP-binding protein, partial [Firmicutes bacterium]|nr:AMP-binding protein [Bacillota bacterium]
GSVGRLMPHIEARIEEPDEAGIGELVVRAESVMLGYYEDPEATAAVLQDGWFHTGDLAYFDEDDYLFIAGRKKNVIVMKNGKNVFPEEIENLINNLPYVAESMIFARNKESDLVLWAKIVCDPEFLREEGLTPEALQERAEADLALINESMPSYKMVKHFFLSDRPTIKTTTQKTKRKDELRQIRAELTERGL